MSKKIKSRLYTNLDFIGVTGTELEGFEPSSDGVKVEGSML